MNTITAPIAAETPAPATPESAPAETPAAPPSNQSTTPEQLQDVKLVQLIDQKPSFDTLKKLGLAKLAALAKENVEAQSRVKNAADKFKRTAKSVGKILAAMKITHADAKDNGTLPKGQSFEDYHKSVTGEKPWNHAMQCARVFDSLVLTGRLLESDYDRRAADWLQHASVILGKLLESGAKLDCPEVTKLVEILKSAADDEGAKLLRQMKAGLKGAVEGEAGDEKLLTVDDLKNADVLVRRVAQLSYKANGTEIHGLNLVAGIVAEYTKSEKREDVLRQLYAALNNALDAIAPELQDQFVKEIEDAKIKTVSEQAQASHDAKAA